MNKKIALLKFRFCETTNQERNENQQQKRQFPLQKHRQLRLHPRTVKPSVRAQIVVILMTNAEQGKGEALR